MKLAEKAELFVLLALHELGGAKWRNIFNHLRRRRYTPVQLDDRDFPSLRFDLVSNGYVAVMKGEYRVTEKGVKQLRFLCGQAGTADATPDGHERIRAFRARYDNEMASKSPVVNVPKTGKLATPDARLLQQERLREEAGEGYPYRILARAKGKRVGNYHVYVIHLDEKIKDKHPNKVGDDPDLPAVYVGQSYHPPKDRFQQHKEGIHASRHVRRFGLELIPYLYQPYNPLSSQDEALRVEAALAEKLRRLGYTVFGGH